MPIGFQSFTPNGVVQLDSEVKHLVYKTKGTITSFSTLVSGISKIGTVTYTGVAPVLCVQEDHGVVLKVVKSGSTYTFTIVTKTAISSVAYYIFDVISGSPTGNSGLQLFTSTGDLSFDSNQLCLIPREFLSISDENAFTVVSGRTYAVAYSKFPIIGIEGTPLPPEGENSSYIIATFFPTRTTSTLLTLQFWKWRGNGATSIGDTALGGTSAARATVPVTASIIDVTDLGAAPPSTTYTIIPNVDSVNEGNSVVFTVTTTNFGSGTLYWTTTGTTNSSDFTSTNSGSVTITNNIGSITRTLSNDVTTEGSESFALELRTGSTSGTIVATSTNVTVNDTSVAPTYSASATTPVNEGSSSTVTVTTTNVTNGTTLYWTVLNSTTANADFSDTSGSFTVNSNSGSFTVPIVADSTTEGSETFSVQIRTVSTSGSVVATSNTVTINDTSLTPTYSITPIATTVNEGDAPSFSITTTNFGSGTLYWTTTGTVNSADFTDNTLSGSVSITNNTGSITRTLSNDVTTEGSESFALQLRTGSTSGTIVATSATVTVNDTSTAAFTPVTITRTSGTNATETVPSGATQVTIRVGGGGGAGGCRSSVTVGGGGGEGGYCERTIAVTGGNTMTYSVGASVAGRSTAGSGTNGNTSSVSGTVSGGSISMTANGGSGGTSFDGGAGGTASGGTTNITGVAGSSSDDGGAGGSGASNQSGAGGFGSQAPDTSGEGARGEIQFYYT